MLEYHSQSWWWITCSGPQMDAADGMLSSWPSAGCLCLFFHFISTCQNVWAWFLRTSEPWVCFFFFLTNTHKHFFLAPLNHLCQGHKSKTPSADGWIEVCVFSPVCTRESRHFISFNSRVFPRRKRADPSCQLCIQRNIVVCRGAALDTHLHLDSVCDGWGLFAAVSAWKAE